MTGQRFISKRSNVKLALDTDPGDEFATFRTIYGDDVAASDMDATQAAAIIRQLTDWLAAQATRPT